MLLALRNIFFVAAVAAFSACVSTISYESEESDVFVPNPGLEYDDETYNLLKITVVTSTIGSEMQEWIVRSEEESEPTVDNFANVRDLLEIAESNGTKVSIELQGITHIPDYAFYRGDTSSSSFNFSYDTALVAISSDDVTHIGSNAFAGEESYSTSMKANINLESANFPNVVEIGYYTFYRCGKLTSVNMPKLEVVPQYAFSDCYTLESIELPSATSVEAYAFRHCWLFAELVVAGDCIVNSSAFLGTDYSH